MAGRRRLGEVSTASTSAASSVGRKGWEAGIQRVRNKVTAAIGAILKKEEEETETESETDSK
eukprot:scaffold32859_cov99-Amphora_coffeaeformis.AAC.2